uniref:TMV resistance protein N n=1 Tax=Solanum tuberosum TaxID=4113 RepID=M1BJT5_SOLTU
MIEGNKLIMHQMLRDMGREIVRQESPKKPGRRTRLWHYKDSFNVLRENVVNISFLVYTSFSFGHC